MRCAYSPPSSLPRTVTFPCPSLVHDMCTLCLLSPLKLPLFFPVLFFRFQVKSIFSSSNYTAACSHASFFHGQHPHHFSFASHALTGHTSLTLLKHCTPSFFSFSIPYHSRYPYCFCCLCSGIFVSILLFFPCPSTSHMPFVRLAL